MGKTLTKVDKQDSHLLSSGSVLVNKKTGYAYRCRYVKGKRIHTLLHHDIIGKPAKGYEVDHINRDRLDNRRKNLRFVTSAQNKANSKKRCDSKQLYRGVDCTLIGKYRARIKVDGVHHHLGVFASAKKAYEVYKKEFKKIHGFSYKEYNYG